MTVFTNSIFLHKTVSRIKKFFFSDIMKTLKGQKRKRETELPAPIHPISGHNNNNGSLSDPDDPDGSISGSISGSTSGGSKKKKVRTTFTGRQIFELEKMFENKKYLSSSERSDLAKLLNVTEQQVI